VYGLRAHRFFYHERERRRWQNPEAILTDVGLKTGLTFVDVGCGNGFFTIPAARIVGNSGRVYGLDVDDEAIGTLRRTVMREGLQNVSLKVGAAGEAVFCEACADVVFFGIVLHDFSDVPKVLLNARKMLRSSGKLVDLDWKKKPMELGPPVSVRFSEEQAVGLIETAGFRLERVTDCGLFHYLIVAGL
jgi:ubiquinone/menaquinone biosynthesis C-methylase UbiE